jgi:hypothetical protein
MRSSPTYSTGSATKTKRTYPEKKIQNRIVKDLKTLGFWVNNLSQPRASKQTPGLPDLYVWHERLQIHLWIEVKAGKNKLTTDQQVWHRSAKAAGVNVLTAYGTEDVLNELRRLGAPIT